MQILQWLQVHNSAGSTIRNTLKYTPSPSYGWWPFMPCHLQSRRPTLPWRKQNSNLDHLVNFWTSNAASEDALWRTCLCKLTPGESSFSFGKSNSPTRNDTSHVQKMDDALISDELKDLRWLRHSGQRCPTLPAFFVCKVFGSCCRIKLQTFLPKFLAAEPSLKSLKCEHSAATGQVPECVP